MAPEPAVVKHRPKAMEVLTQVTGIMRFNRAADRKRRGETYRQCAVTHDWCFFMKEAKERKEGKEAKRAALKIIGKKRLTTAVLEKHHVPNTMQDVCTQRNFKARGAPDDGVVIALSDTAGCVYIIKLFNEDEVPADGNQMIAFQVLASAKVTQGYGSKFSFYKLEFWDADTLIGRGSDGSLWALDVPTMIEAFVQENPQPIYGYGDKHGEKRKSDDADSSPPPHTPIVIADDKTVYSHRGGFRLARAGSCSEFDCGANYIAYTAELSPNVMLLTKDKEGHGFTLAGEFEADDTPASCVQWLGSEVNEQYKFLSNVLVVVTDWGKSVLFYRVVSPTVQTKLFHVNIDDVNNEWEVPKALLNEGSEKILVAAKENMFVMTAMGRRSLMACSLMQDAETRELSLHLCDCLVTSAEEASRQTSEEELGVLLSVALDESHQVCYLTSKQYNRAELVMRQSDKVASIVEDEAVGAVAPPRPQQPPPPLPSTPAVDRQPAPVEPSLVTPEKAERMKTVYATPHPAAPPTAVLAAVLPASTTAPPPPPPPISFQPLQKVTDESDLGKGLAVLQHNLLSLQDTLASTHQNLVHRFQVLDHNISAFTADIRTTTEANQALIRKQSADIHTTAHTEYYSKIQSGLREAQDKLRDDLKSLGDTLREPVQKMFKSLEQSSKESKENVDKSLKRFEDEIAALMQNQIGEQLKGANIGAKGLATEFSKELKSQIQAMLELRMEEICDFQVHMELDYAEVCKAIEVKLEETFVRAKEDAAREAGQQLGQHERQTVTALRTLASTWTQSLSSISGEFRNLAAIHERSKKEAEARLEQFMQQEAQTLPPRPQQAQPPIGLAAARPSFNAAAPATPQQELDRLTDARRFEESIDYINRHTGTLSMRAFRARIFQEMETVVPGIGVEYRQNLFRDVLMSMREDENVSVRKWLMTLIRHLSLRDLQMSTGATPEQFAGLVDWGLAESVSHPDSTIKSILAKYRKGLTPGYTGL